MALREDGAGPSTLPQWLARQASQRPDEVAVRHKTLGRWQARSWRDLGSEVQRLAGALHARGFTEGAALVILSRPRPEALLLALAAQSLGGVAVPLDPLLGREALAALLRGVEPVFLFAETHEELGPLQALGARLRLLVLGDPRGAAQYRVEARQRLDYAGLLASQPIPSPLQVGEAVAPAFAFYRLGPGGALERQALTHAALLREARHLLRSQDLGADEEALAARAFAAGGQARYLLAPWLVAGFRLNFPETLATRDNDRQALAPTLVLGTRETYGRLFRQVQARLPAEGSPTRRLVDWALAEPQGRAQRWLGDWLVRRRLRRQLGFTRTHAPLLVGEPLEEPARRFFVGLGLSVRHWPEPADWQRSPASGAQVPLPAGSAWPAGA